MSADDGFREPQYITARDPTSARIYLASINTPPGTDRTKCTVGNTNQPLTQGINRIRVSDFHMMWNTPNVNPRNNVIQFVVNGDPTTYSVNLGTQNITSFTTLTSDIATAMTAAGSGRTFTYVDFSPAIPNYGKIQIDAGHSFYFVPTCSAVAKGSAMYNLQREIDPLNPVFAPFKTIGPAGLQYTVWIDVVSRAITKWTKVSSVSSDNVAPIIARVPVETNDMGRFVEPPLSVSFAWNSGEPIYSIDVSLYDENGDQFFALNGGQTELWQLTLSPEI